MLKIWVFSLSESFVNLSVSTELVGNRGALLQPLLFFINSTSNVEHILLRNDYRGCIIGSGYSSLVKISSCKLIMDRLLYTPFCSYGKLVIDNILIDSGSEVVSFISCLRDWRKEKSTNEESLVVMENTCIDNVKVAGSSGTLLSSGNTFEQDVKFCNFYNITTSFLKTFMDDSGSNSFHCNIKGSNMNNVEDFLYGRIITGLTEKTVMSFTSFNCSYDNCFRLSKKSYFVSLKQKYENKRNNNININIGEEDPSLKEKEKESQEDEEPPSVTEINDKQFSTHYDYNNSSFSFNHCQFNSIKHDKYGGAILLSG